MHTADHTSVCLLDIVVRHPYAMQDLALYKKFRNKEVASAARGLIGLFRELAPGMLEKRDRGRGADVEAAPLSYGASHVASRVEGAELLQVIPLAQNIAMNSTSQRDIGLAKADMHKQIV